MEQNIGKKRKGSLFIILEMMVWQTKLSATILRGLYHENKKHLTGFVHNGLKLQ